MEQRHPIAEPTRNLDIVCGVSPISGTSTIAPRPRSSAAAAAARYTSVLPDPVTPWSSSSAPVAVHRRHDPRHGALLLGTQLHPPRRLPDRNGGRPAPTSTSRNSTSPLVSRRRNVARSRSPSPPAAERFELRALAGPEPRGPAESLAARGRDLGPQLVPGPHPLAARARPRRQHQPEAASRRRAVLAPRPQPQADELRRDTGLQRLDRLRQPPGRQLARLGQIHHDAEHPPPAERDHQHAPHSHAVHRRRQAIVERPAQRAGRRVSGSTFAIAGVMASGASRPRRGHARLTIGVRGCGSAPSSEPS